MIHFVQKLEKTNLKGDFQKKMFECFVRSRHLFVCQSLHTLKTQLSCMDVGFHSNFGLQLEGRELVSGSLLLIIWEVGGGGGGGWTFVL